MLLEITIACLSAVTLGSLWFAAVVTAPERPRKRVRCAAPEAYCPRFNDPACETSCCAGHCESVCRCREGA